MPKCSWQVGSFMAFALAKMRPLPLPFPTPSNHIQFLTCLYRAQLMCSMRKVAILALPAMPALPVNANPALPLPRRAVRALRARGPRGPLPGTEGSKGAPAAAAVAAAGPGTGSTGQQVTPRRVSLQHSRTESPGMTHCVHKIHLYHFSRGPLFGGVLYFPEATIKH